MGPKSKNQRPGSGNWCCLGKDARHCLRKRPGLHRTGPEQIPDIFVPHYDEHCSCFSCRWVRETKFPFILSKTGLARSPYPVANPTHDRVPQDDRQRLLTSAPKGKFQIMYIYAMQLEESKWGWVVVLPLPLLPFLLTDEKYSAVCRFARHPKHGWVGLKEDGQRVNVGHEMEPPLYNPHYEYYGYDPQCSPYRLYPPPHDEKASDSKAHSSSNDDINPSTEDSTSPPAQNSTKPSTRDTTTFPSPGSKTNSPRDDQAAPPVMDQINSAITRKLGNPSDEVPANTSPEAQDTSCKPPTDQSTSDNDRWLENPEWIVVDPRCANPPQASGPVNAKCTDPRHNGKYNERLRSHRHANWRNTTIFVGGLNKAMTLKELHAWFEGFGELMYVRKTGGETCGFVQYAGRKEAEMAMSQMQGFPVHGARLRLSWGNPKKIIDTEYWEHYRESAWKAYWGREDFKARMAQGKERREDDPDFFTL